MNKFFLISIFIWLCVGCYSFRGVNITPGVKSISIHYIENHAPIVEPSLSQSITETVKSKFLQGTNLSLIESNGDLDLSGTITGYSVTPVAATGSTTASLNRLTITLSMTFTNSKDEKQNWNSTFTRFADFESNQSLSAALPSLLSQINDQLSDDIFNKAVVNW